METDTERWTDADFGDRLTQSIARAAAKIGERRALVAAFAAAERYALSVATPEEVAALLRASADRIEDRDEQPTGPH